MKLNYIISHTTDESGAVYTSINRQSQHDSLKAALRSLRQKSRAKYGPVLIRFADGAKLHIGAFPHQNVWETLEGCEPLTDAEQAAF